MIKKLAVLALALAILPQASFASKKVHLSCAFEPDQEVTEMLGYLIVDGESGGMQRMSIVNGVVGERLELSTKIIQEGSDVVSSDPVHLARLAEAKVSVSEVTAVRTVAITEANPIIDLINYVDKSGKMLTGVMVYPDGGTKACYPTK